MILDKRALKILFDTYWCSSGWKSAGNHQNWTPQTPAEDLRFAMQAGVMFPPRKTSHRDALQRIGELRNQTSPQAVGAAFLASLSSGALGLRSALGSYAVALHMPSHAYQPWNGEAPCCVCGEYDLEAEQDINILNFERHK